MSASFLAGSDRWPLQPHTHSLETLNLGHNPIGNEGVRNLKNGLIGNRSVLRLGLASTKLTCEGRARGRAQGRCWPGGGGLPGVGPWPAPAVPLPGAVAVAEFIAESPRLLRLDLRENEIKTGGLMALSLALKVNHSLLRLDLDREPKKEAVSRLFPAGGQAGRAGPVWGSARARCRRAGGQAAAGRWAAAQSPSPARSAHR